MIETLKFIKHPLLKGFLVFAGATVLALTAYNLYLQIQLNRRELSQ